MCCHFRVGLVEVVVEDLVEVLVVVVVVAVVVAVEVVEAQEEDVGAATIASKAGILPEIASSLVATAKRKVILPPNVLNCPPAIKAPAK